MTNKPKCNCCDNSKTVTETDWLDKAEEEIETFYCDNCRQFLGVGNLK